MEKIMLPLGRRLKAVSYTHLDVYKRQAPVLREAEQGLSKFKIEGNEEAPHS